MIGGSTLRVLVPLWFPSGSSLFFLVPWMPQFSMHFLCACYPSSLSPSPSSHMVFYFSWDLLSFSSIHLCMSTVQPLPDGELCPAWRPHGHATWEDHAQPCGGDDGGGSGGGGTPQQGREWSVQSVESPSYLRGLATLTAVLEFDLWRRVMCTVIL